MAVAGPKRAYAGQDATFKVTVTNGGEVALTNVLVRAQLPTGFAFRSASDAGTAKAGAVEWNLGTAPADREKVLTFVAAADKPTAKATVVATALADPLAADAPGGPARTVSLRKPLKTAGEATIEVLGVPALDLAVSDDHDPVQVGLRTTFRIRVTNGGTLAAKDVAVSAEVPALFRVIRAAGPTGAGQVEGTKVTFPAADSVPAGREGAYTVEVEAVTAGESRFRAEVKSLVLTSPLRADEPTRVLARGR